MAIITLEEPVPASEEEKLILENRAAERAAEVIEDAFAFSCWGGRLKELSCPKGLILMIFKQHAVELIRAGLGDHGDGRAARHPLLGIEIIGRNVHFLNGLRRRHIDSVVRQPDEHVRSAVHARIIVVPVGAVDVEAQRAFRRVRNSVLKSSRSCPRHEIDQGLKIAVLIERHVQDGFFGQLRVNVGLFRLQGDRGCLNRDLLRHRPHLQAGVGIGDGVCRNHQVRLGERLKTADLDREVVVAGRKVHNKIVTGVVGVRFTRNPRGAIDDNQMRFRHTGSALVRHRTCYRPV